jgi:protease I
MFKQRKLKGRRIAVLAADGFEKVELTVPVKALRAAGAEVDVVSLRKGRIRGVNLHEPASRVSVDYTLADAAVEDYDGLLIPGGLMNPDLLRQSAEARQFVREFDAAGKPIATLCHGPWLLASAGLTEGRNMTSWPGVRDDLVNAGATWLDAAVVRDGNWLTSRGPQDISAFVKSLIPFFAGEGEQGRSRVVALTSAPQREAPPELPLKAMKWLPRPSFRAAAVIGALLAVYLARGRPKAPVRGLGSRRLLRLA